MGGDFRHPPCLVPFCGEVAGMRSRPVPTALLRGYRRVPVSVRAASRPSVSLRNSTNAQKLRHLHIAHSPSKDAKTAQSVCKLRVGCPEGGLSGGSQGSGAGVERARQLLAWVARARRGRGAGMARAWR
eukprot:gene18780-biopygen3967